MATKKKVEPVEAVTENTPEVNTPVEEKAVKEEKKVEPVEAVKVYRFTSANPFLTVASLGVQFSSGVASTTDLAVARALATIEGVKLVED